MKLKVGLIAVYTLFLMKCCVFANTIIVNPVMANSTPASIKPFGLCDVSKDLNSLSWLVGKWISKTDSGTTIEHWNKVSPKTFEGMGANYRDNSLKSSESLRIVAMSGEVFYLAKVKSNPIVTPFKLTSCSKSSVTFENKGHDFPKKLVYQLIQPNKLDVFVTGENNKGFVIHFEKNFNE